MTYIWYKTANNAVSFLTSATSSISNQIIVNDWWVFPSVFPYLLTVEQQNWWETIVREIMKATAKSWNTITVERAVESCVSDDTTTPKVFVQIAQNFEANSIVSLSMTAWTLKDVQDEIVAQSWRIQDAEDEITDLNALIVKLEWDIADL